MHELIRAIWAKRFVVIGISMALGLLAGLASMSRDPTFAAHLTYRAQSTTVSLDAKSVAIFFGRFYSQDNVQRLSEQLTNSGAPKTASWLNSVNSEELWRSSIDLEVVPGYIDYRNKSNLKITLERSWADNIEKLEDLKAELLQVNVTGTERTETESCVQAVRANVEQQLALYWVRDELLRQLHHQRMELAGLQRLEPHSTWLAEKGALTAESLAKINSPQNSPTIHVELSQVRPDILPVTMQAQYFEAESIRIEHESTFRANMMTLHQLLIALRSDSIKAIDTLLETGGTVQDYLDYCRNLETDPLVASHLDSDYQYAAALQDNFSPVNPDPLIIREPRGTVAKAAFAFLIGLIGSLLWVSFSVRLRD